MTAPERPVSAEAEDLANELRALKAAIPAYTSRPNLTLGFGLKIADLVERLAKQVEGLQ